MHCAIGLDGGGTDHLWNNAICETHLTRFVDKEVLGHQICQIETRRFRDVFAIEFYGLKRNCGHQLIELGNVPIVSRYYAWNSLLFKFESNTEFWQLNVFERLVF